MKLDLRALMGGGLTATCHVKPRSRWWPCKGDEEHRGAGENGGAGVGGGGPGLPIPARTPSGKAPLPVYFLS